MLPTVATVLAHKGFFIFLFASAMLLLLVAGVLATIFYDVWRESSTKKIGYTLLSIYWGLWAVWVEAKVTFIAMMGMIAFAGLIPTMFCLSFLS